MGYIEFEPNAIHSNGAKLYFPPPVTIVCQFVFKISTRNTYSSNMEFYSRRFNIRLFACFNLLLFKNKYERKYRHYAKLSANDSLL